MPKQKVSKVWECFEKEMKNDKSFVRCRVCEEELTFNKDGSTGAMKKHIERRHPVKYAQLFPPLTSPTNKSQDTQMTLTQSFNQRQPLAKDSPRYVSFTQNILKMICVDLQPLSFTEDAGFRSLMKTAESRYVPPSRSTFRNKLIPELYASVLTKLKHELNLQLTDCKVVSITTDAWSARTVSSYITYNLHLVNSDFTMVAYNIGTFEYTKDHTAVNLRNHIYKALAHVGLLKVRSIPGDTHDHDATAIDLDADIAMDEDDEDELMFRQDEEDADADVQDADSSEENDEPEIEFVIPEDLEIFISSDNASNITKAISDEPRFTHIRCFAHTINLAVQKGLKEPRISAHLIKVRKIAKYFRKSNKGKYALMVSPITSDDLIILYKSYYDFSTSVYR